MDQKKIGQFIKELRKEKGITQEQLAEVFKVSGRTISRWENGNNMPDISLLVGISNFFDVDVRELIEGERKSETMNEDIKEVADKMADYAGSEKEKILKSILRASIMGIIICINAIVYLYIEGKSIDDTIVQILLLDFSVLLGLISMVAGVVATAFDRFILESIRYKVIMVLSFVSASYGAICASFIIVKSIMITISNLVA